MKKEKPKGYRIETYPASRVATFDVGQIGRKKHHIAGFVEADVTLSRRKITSLILQGKSVGFTAWVIKAVADTAAMFPRVHALNGRGRKQYLFEDVDVSVPIEREVDGQKVPLVAVIRGADKKSVFSIADEMESFKRQTVQSAGDFVLGEKRKSSGEALFFRMPQGLRLLFWKLLLGSPLQRKRNMGTVMVTNVGPGGGVTGWILPKSLHNLAIGIGSVNKMPRVVKDTVEIREILHLTILFDHDVVDGGPAARFVARLVSHLENAHGLESSPAVEN